jgi:LysM repeat protein
LATLLLTACGGGGTGGTPGDGPGDALVIVTATPGTPPAPGARGRYRVEPGDTLSAIAARFDVSEEALRRANGIDDPDELVAGRVLVVPTPEP